MWAGGERHLHQDFLRVPKHCFAAVKRDFSVMFANTLCLDLTSFHPCNCEITARTFTGSLVNHFHNRIGNLIKQAKRNIVFYFLIQIAICFFVDSQYFSVICDLPLAIEIICIP